jgi:hypothetical protein
MSATRPETPGPAEHGLLADITTTMGGVLLVVASLFGMLQGGAAIGSPEFYAAGSDYLYRFNVTAWGWIQVVTGVIGIVVAVGILRQVRWGQVAGIVWAALAMVVNFMFIPFYPVWAVTVIAFNALVVWALTAQLRH